MAKEEDQHHRGHAIKMLILGVLVLMNANQQFISWWAFLGWVIVLKGLGKLLMPHHCHHDCH